MLNYRPKKLNIHLIETISAKDIPIKTLFIIRMVDAADGFGVEYCVYTDKHRLWHQVYNSTSELLIRDMFNNLVNNINKDWFNIQRQSTNEVIFEAKFPVKL